MELYVAARAVRNYLTTHSGLNAKVERMYVGSFMTSLEMQGLMVTCFVFDNPLQIARIDAFTAAPGWPKRASKKQVVEDLARESQVYGFSIESEAYGSNPDTDVTERFAAVGALLEAGDVEAAAALVPDEAVYAPPAGSEALFR